MDKTKLDKTSERIFSLVARELTHFEALEKLSKDQVIQLKYLSDIITVSYARQEKMGSIDWTVDASDEELENEFS